MAGAVSGRYVGASLAGRRSGAALPGGARGVASPGRENQAMAANSRSPFCRNLGSFNRILLVGDDGARQERGGKR